MKLKLGFVSMFCIALGAASCKDEAAPGGGGGSVAGSCNLSSAGSCINFIGSHYTAETIQQGCAVGTYSASACDTANSLGTCTVSDSVGGSSVTYYYSPFWDSIISSAESACTGTWNAAGLIYDEELYPEDYESDGE